MFEKIKLTPFFQTFQFFDHNPRHPVYLIPYFKKHFLGCFSDTKFRVCNEPDMISNEYQN